MEQIDGEEEKFQKESFRRETSSHLEESHDYIEKKKRY